MSPRPITPAALTELLAELCFTSVPVSGGWLRVAVDGAPAARPEALADGIAEHLERLGIPALRVSTRWFLRPASLRYEHGREDIQSYAEDWLDADALRREILTPLGPNGSGRWLPTLWDPERDRATRAAYEQAPAKAVALVDGGLLLGRGLAFDLRFHLRMSMPALRRRTPADEAWTLPAYEDYAATIEAERPDVLIRNDDPRHPAIDLRS